MHYYNVYALTTHRQVVNSAAILHRRGNDVNAAGRTIARGDSLCP